MAGGIGEKDRLEGTGMIICKHPNAKMISSDWFREYYKCPDCGERYSISYDEIS